MEFNLILAFTAAFLLGVGKGGIKGLSILTVTLMALAYGAKSSTGIILPLLIVGDIMAVIYFKKYTKWKYLVHFLPWMLVGVVIASFVGKDIPETTFKNWMAAIILVSVVFMWFSESTAKKVMPGNKLFGGSVGFAAGFTTMIGNLAGPFANLFFLATRLPKNEIIGTSAWVFFIVNNFKVPFHVFSWKTITWETLQTNLTLVPFVTIGFFVGVKIVSYFTEKFFRQFLLVVTAIGAILIFIK
ncbi:MAG: sulfite exporter TauE/SafE family protein [Saprospiraceae bacterium]